jgi:hypothetical protein
MNVCSVVQQPENEQHDIIDQLHGAAALVLLN